MTLTGPTVWLSYEATSDPVLLFLLCNNPSGGPGVVVVAGCPPPEEAVVVVPGCPPPEDAVVVVSLELPDDGAGVVVVIAGAAGTGGSVRLREGI